LQDFLELQNNATGPTIDEFLATFSISTNSLFGLVDNYEDSSVFVKYLLPTSQNLKVSKAIKREAIASFEKIEHRPLGKESITESYKLKGKIMSRKSYGFQMKSIDSPFCKVA
ncbi:hypothetical protein CXF61_01420, partial [Psychrobacter sp. 4Dc]|uniref:hypothetical protein n=1 Tax=Psychrobacter sp. 4Dc TaxID=888437 RepID=UPI000CBF4662